MQQGLSPWFILFGLAWIAISIVGWIRFRSQRAEMFTQLDDVRGNLVPKDGSHATVTMFRKRSLIGLRNLHYVYCDEQPIAALKNGRFDSVAIATGEHVFTAADDGGPAPGTPITATILPNQEMFIEFSRSGLTSVVFRTIDPAQAPRELAGLKSAA